jgi:hypothetical protein
VILDLYQGFYRGEPLGPGDRILSFDAKPSIQARGRIHQPLPAAPGKPARVEHEYVRHGALALLAGRDVHTGKVFASTPQTTGIAPFTDLVGHVMTRPEYKDAPRVFIIVDNGSDHRGRKAAARLRRAHPNAVMIHTPVHASWLNQIEVFFSVNQKKVISPNDFPSLEQLSETLLAFTSRYNQTAKPFNWKYTAGDLKDLLRKRANLMAACLTKVGWREQWDAARMFLTADGQASAPWGNLTIRWNPDESWLDPRRRREPRRAARHHRSPADRAPCEPAGRPAPRRHQQARRAPERRLGTVLPRRPAGGGCQLKRAMKASAVSATSRHPPSMVSACPRFGISANSVTPGLCRWRLNAASEIARGTVLSFSPEMISSGPRSGFSVSALASVHGLTFSAAAWNRGAPEAGTANVS